jgi:hypothetical protein
LRFHFDTSISSRIAEAMERLADFDHDLITIHDSLFRPEEKDEVWIPALAARDGATVIVSADPDILRERRPKEALLSSGLSGFFFAGGFASLEAWDQAIHIVRSWPAIRGAAASLRRPAHFRVTMQRKVERVTLR